MPEEKEEGILWDGGEAEMEAWLPLAYGSNKTIYKMIIGSRFLTAGEGSCRYATGKTRMNPLLLD